ncbi:hypothetical protein O6H91_10G084300 [Diphasiastrum complanatum]|uniref:Uncharacterized protein n=1 Tax=Diphasiastrum complanatum TaxID=34168 RepID=A0ACC2CJ28_DIPCM|nr:hypothetical protein O6H91_10G084300 [Diphasiastrum complanatum]
MGQDKRKNCDLGVLVVEEEARVCYESKECVKSSDREGLVKAEDESEVEQVVVEVDADDGNRVIRWLRTRVSDPLILFLRRGTEPRKLAMSVAVGIAVGIFPICVLKTNCHPPTLLLVNFIATPLELSLVIPFMRLGEWMVDGEQLVLSTDAFWDAITGQASKEVLSALMHALLGWSVAFPFIIVILYICLLPLIRYATRKYGCDVGHMPIQTPIKGNLTSITEPLILVKT